MSAPLVPSPLDYVGRGCFAFYPPIRAAGPNEWFLLNRGWSEVQIANARNGQRIWLPRHYICGVSVGENPEIVVELTKELSFQQGAVSPTVKQVIEMPRSVARPAKRSRKRRRRMRAAVVDIRLQSRSRPHVRLLAKFGLGAVALFVLSALSALVARL